MKSKPFWMSSTLWINFLGLVALVLNYFIKNVFIPDPDLIALLVAVANILNRFRDVKKVDLTMT